MDDRDQQAERIEAVRAFNRFWTTRIGVLSASHLSTEWSLTEARVIYELAQRDTMDVADLRRRLEIDAGYLSRILARFTRDGLISALPSAEDRRRKVVRLSARGKRAYKLLDARSVAQVQGLLAPLGLENEQKIAGALALVRRTLEQPGASPRAFVVRAPLPGDLGWLVFRHGALYAEEYGWDMSFEALVAKIVAEFMNEPAPRRGAAWIAEVDGERAGAVLCVRKSPRVAQLRLLLVEPKFRGLGIGARLVDECSRFARAQRYQKLVLWTNGMLHGARRIYERAGFRRTAREQHESFGHDLVGETWELTLSDK
jgi:DNA-binding MarR family transcriptional regulator/GNAT superfamily N-acetyltransferase